MQMNYTLAFAGQTYDRELSADLSPAAQDLTGPSSFDAVPTGQTDLGLALANASLEINGLALEQVRLRETLETLNSTLFINGNSLMPRDVDANTCALKCEPKEPPASAAKSVVDELWESAKSKAADKVIDLAVDAIGKAFKGRKKIGPRRTGFRSRPESAGKPLGGAQMGFHSGAPLQGFQSFVGTRSLTPALDLPRGSTNALSSVLGKFEAVGTRRLGPLRYADTAIDVIQGVRNGDAKAVATGLSTAGGAWAGASAGAAIGTLVFPGVGTAVGGAIGGLLGSEAGAWLGEKLFGPSDRLPAPNAVSKELNSARTDNVQVTIAPSIQITGVNPADAQQVVNQVIQALQFQCMPMVTDTLGIRRNAALADPGGD